MREAMGMSTPEAMAAAPATMLPRHATEVLLVDDQAIIGEAVCHLLAAEAIALGANDYLVKLADKVELIGRMRHDSKGVISVLERNDAYKALEQMANQLQLHNPFIRKTVGRYLTDDVVKSLLGSAESLRLDGERRKITLVTTDLRSFTPMSGRSALEQVVIMLTRYLGTMVEVIQKYQGSIDKFSGVFRPPPGWVFSRTSSIDLGLVPR
jgi:hypothetical protein